MIYRVQGAGVGPIIHKQNVLKLGPVTMYVGGCRDIVLEPKVLVSRRLEDKKIKSRSWSRLFASNNY